MKCISCAADVPEGGQFCPKCGARQGFPGSPDPPPPLEPEVDVWSGRYSALADGASWILWALYAGSLTFVALKWLTLAEPWMRWTYWGAVFLPAAAIGVVSLFRRISIRYRLTSHRLFREIGVLSRRITEIELLRIDDLSVSQNIMQRIFGVGVVTLLTSDSSDPKVVIAGIRDPIEVKEHIRTHVQKRRGRTVNLESL